MKSPVQDKLTIGTRGSLLARAQTDWVADRLRAAHTDLDVEIRIIRTSGDRRSTKPLPEVGGKGLFTLELEDALRDGTIDLAVHSAKDLPTELSEGLAIVAVPMREDARDAWVSRAGGSPGDLPEAAVVGTSSPRRQAQLLMLRPDLQFTVLRGNVDTRLRKVRRGDCDATVLAQAGLNRAGLSDAVTCTLEFETMLPAAGQGALALEGRSGDDRVNGLVAALHDVDTAAALHCERRLIERLAAGCLAPIAAHARRMDERLRLDALVVSPKGDRHVRADAATTVDAFGDLADRVAERLLEQGAAELIAESRSSA